MDIIKIARECGASIGPTSWILSGEKAIFDLPEELQQFTKRIEQPHLQRILELTQRAEKVADSLEQAEKRLTEIAFKACATLDTKDAQIAQLREALLHVRQSMYIDERGDWALSERFNGFDITRIDKALEQTQ